MASYRNMVGDNYLGNGFVADLVTLVVFRFTDDNGNTTVSRYSENDCMIGDLSLDNGEFLGDSFRDDFLGYYEGRLLDISGLTISKPNANVKESDPIYLQEVNIKIANITEPAGGYATSFNTGVYVYILELARGKSGGENSARCLFYGKVRSVEWDISSVKVKAMDILFWVLDQTLNVQTLTKARFSWIGPTEEGAIAPIVMGEMTSAATTKQGKVPMVCVNGSQKAPEWERRTQWAVAGHPITLMRNVYWKNGATDRWEVLDPGTYETQVKSFGETSVSQYNTPFPREIFMLTLNHTEDDPFVFPDGQTSAEYNDGLFADVYGMPLGFWATGDRPRYTATNPLDVLALLLCSYSSLMQEYAIGTSPDELQGVYGEIYTQQAVPDDHTLHYYEYAKLLNETPLKAGTVATDKDWNIADAVRTLCQEFGLRVFSVPPRILAEPGRIPSNIGVDWFDVPLSKFTPTITLLYPYFRYSTPVYQRDYVGQRTTTETDDIAEDSWQPQSEDRQVANYVEVEFGKDFTDQAKSNYWANAVAADSRLIQTAGENRFKISTEYVYDQRTASTLALMRLWRYRQNQTYFEYETGMRESMRVPGDLVMLRYHPLLSEGPNITNWTGRVTTMGIVASVDINPVRKTVKMRVLNSVGLYGPYSLLGDGDSLPAKWQDMTDPYTESGFLYLCDEETGMLPDPTPEVGKTFIGG